MKFAKDLKQSMIPEWAESYLDYSKLKELIKAAEASKDEVAAPFFEELQSELDKVNRFYLDRVNEYEKRADAVENPPTKEGEAAEHGAKPRSRPGSFSAVEGHNSAADFETMTIHRELGRLQNYVWINWQGLSKTIKKFDKRLNLRGTDKEKGPAWEIRLRSEVFRSAQLDSLISRVVLMREKLTKPKSRGSGMDIKLIAGNGNPLLAEEVAGRLGLPICQCKVGQFADGEVQINIGESVRGCDVYIIQPTCVPVNDNLMQLLLLISACRRASAAQVTAVIPYYGYARQDRKDRSRAPISAADVARMMEAMGVDRVVSIDLHCAQIQGMFSPRTPVDNLYASPIAWSFFKTRNLVNPVVVSPDAGGVTRAKLFREGLASMGVDAQFAVIIKQRTQPGVVGTMDLVGDVKGRDCVIVDDMIDTAGTLCKAADELRNFGATRVFAFATHGLFNGPAGERIEKSALELVAVANTIPLREETLAVTKKIRQLSVGKLLAATINSCHTGESVSYLFNVENSDKLLS
jgi:ribose-phosphate pyrophosphokinase